MKSVLFPAAVYGLLVAREAVAHATFQSLWVNGADMITTDILAFHGTQCARLPLNNNPVTDVGSAAIRCNAGTAPVARKCAVAAGQTVTVEMHQQPGDRSCSNQAIGGSHYGPVMVYLSKVSDSSTADGSADWFKVFEDGWKAGSGGSGDDDMWGTKDLNSCCGRMDVPLPADLAPGDYLLRAEALALHTAGSANGAQFYMTCYQLQVGGGSGVGAGASGSAKGSQKAAMALSASDLVKFPGAYRASDPGILVNIHSKLSDYVVPGPRVIAAGTTRVAGSACAGCEQSCKVGSGPSGTALAGSRPTSAAGTGASAGTGSSAGSGKPAGAAPAGACTVQRYGQCGGTGFTGCTSCAAGLTCSGSSQYYSQCT